MIERWFRTLKTEKISLNEYHSPKKLRKDIADFTQEYNDVRPHESLAYTTPSALFASCFVAAA